MAISERINLDHLNIHQFQEVPEGRPKLPFDPEKEISQSTKEKLRIEVSTSDDVEQYADFAYCYQLLWPQDGPAKSENELLDILVKPLKRYRVDFLSKIKATYPKMDLGLTKSDWIKLTNVDFRKSVNDVVDKLASIKILDPANNIPLDPELIKRIKVDIENDKQAHLDAAASLRLVLPSYNLDITPDEWGEMKESLLELEAVEEWGLYLFLASSMKMIAAYRIEVTAPGVIDIQMYPPEDANTQTPPIPETRKF